VLIADDHSVVREGSASLIGRKVDMTVVAEAGNGREAVELWWSRPVWLQLGYYNGSTDGVFGSSTRDAVAKYQTAKQLNVTGSLSPDTLQSLRLPQATPS
jgi:DNA-binding NarL/FixJ family response regulator